MSDIDSEYSMLERHDAHLTLLEIFEEARLTGVRRCNLVHFKGKHVALVKMVEDEASDLRIYMLQVTPLRNSMTSELIAL